MKSKKLSKVPQKHSYFAIQCPECDWYTWMYTTMEGAYNETMAHIEDEHYGDADFEIVRLAE